MSEQPDPSRADMKKGAPLATAEAGVVHETRNERKTRALVAGRDLGILARLPLMFAIAWSTPESRWPSFARRLSGKNPGLARRIEKSELGASLDPEAVATELEANRIEHSFQYFREYRPKGWRIPHTIEGIENLAEARAAGRGVILWMAHFVFHGLAAKKLIAEQGFRVHHLSRPEHGYSKTRFGIRVLNPLRVRVEDRYLASRVLIVPDAKDTLKERIRSLLHAGEIISITAGAWEGRNIAHVPFMGGYYPLAIGAPALAHKEGAALIPVFCYRSGNNGRLKLIVDKPLGITHEMDRREAVDRAMLEFMGRHAAPVRTAPGEWRGWNYLEPSPPA